jgi:hypothetical protein
MLDDRLAELRLGKALLEDGHQLGWQPSRFLTDRAEAERAFALAERLGSVSAAAVEQDTTWPSRRKAFTRHGLGMLARNPEAVRQRAIAAGRHRSGQSAPPATPPLDPVFVGLNRGQLSPQRGTQPEQGVRLRRAEEIETLSYRTVVALNQESRLAPGGVSPPSPAVPNAPCAWQATAPGAPNAATPSVPPAAAELTTSPRSGGRSLMPANSIWRPRITKPSARRVPARGGVGVRRLADRPAEVIRLSPDGSSTVDCR